MSELSIISTGSRKHVGSGYPSHQPKDTYKGSAGRESATRTLLVEYNGADNEWGLNIPALNYPHPVRWWLAFKDYDLRQKSGKLAEMVLFYEQVEFSTNPNEVPVLPDDVEVENTGIMEIDITRHPKFSSANDQWGGRSMRDLYNPREQRIFMGPVIPDSYMDEDGVTKENEFAGEDVPIELAGMSKYVVGTGTVTIREHFFNKPSNVIPKAGKRGVPAGYSGSADFWLVMGGSRGRDGVFWYQELTYQYSAKPISGFVYDDL